MNQNAVSAGRSSAASPPRPPLTFRIGVVGHRPNRLESADLSGLARQLREVVRAVHDEVLDQHQAHRELYDDSAPIVRVLSPLAEGVNRNFAEQALAERCDLTVVLPFHLEEFEKDFAPGVALESDSLNRFHMILSQSSTVFQLDGSRSDKSLAYRVAEDVVLNQSDILIVVWDGERQNKRAGTEDTFDDAVQRGVPIVWIDAHAPHHWRIVTQPIRLLEEIRPGVRAALTRSHETKEIRRQVQRLIEVPHTAARKVSHVRRNEPYQSALLQRYYWERKPWLNFAFVWKIFRTAVGDGRLHRAQLGVKD